MDGGTVQVFSFLALVRLKWWGGCGLSFFSLSSVAVSSLGVRLFVVGLCSYIDFLWLYFGIIRGFVFYKLLIFFYLLQMVEEGNGPGGL